jgi:UDP-3-O-[3-hydroxymyristoyl] N-acetylglucosamine deacetylase
MPLTTQTVGIQPTAGLLSHTQHTLSDAFSCSGVGLHTGITAQVWVTPAAADTGRTFIRVDLPEQPEVPAQLHCLAQAMLSTELKLGSASVRTVEHLLAALTGLGVDNVRIEVNGPEIPLLDGSALLWSQAIAAVGLVAQPSSRTPQTLSQPIWVYEGDAFVAALPAPELRFTYGIDFDLPTIGNQWQSWAPASSSTFADEIAPARTFGLAHQLESLRSQGLIQGGSLENALICSAEGWVNPPLRFDNEPVRHKLLDLIGDLSLLGTIPQAHFLAYKASHSLHLQLARALLTHLKLEP